MCVDKQQQTQLDCHFRTNDATNWDIIEHQLPVVSWSRISIFCPKSDIAYIGHCRRRKIRCLLAAEDLQGRCSNCIRLKKDCNFFPVDQQALPEKTRQGSKTDSTSGVT